MGKLCGICTTMWPMGLTARQSEQPFEAVDSDCGSVAEGNEGEVY